MHAKHSWHIFLSEIGGVCHLQPWMCCVEVLQGTSSGSVVRLACVAHAAHSNRLSYVAEDTSSQSEAISRLAKRRSAARENKPERIYVNVKWNLNFN